MEIEKTPELITRLEFTSLEAGDVVTITTGRDEEAWKYSFFVEDTSSRWPSGQLVAVPPNSVETASMKMEGSCPANLQA